MARPSRNTDQLLIRAALKLLPATGVSGLTLRKVAAAARVNPGMFHYNFRTKDRFARHVLQEMYEAFFKDFMRAQGSGSPLEQLRASLLELSRFARGHRALILSLIGDVLRGERTVIEFVRENVPRHVGVLGGLVKRCQAEGLLEPMPAEAALTFLLGSIGMPNLAFGLVEKAGGGTERLEGLMVSEAATGRRVELALKALGRRAR